MASTEEEVARNLKKRKRDTLARDETFEASIKVCAWNIQRRACFAHPKSKPNSAALKRAITQLCADYDIVMITEPNKSFYTAVNSDGSTHSSAKNTLPGGGVWLCNNTPDNQSDPHACRPVLFVGDKFGCTPKNLKFKSGAKSAFRYPCSAIVQLPDVAPILVISFHATSGGGGKNTQNLLDSVDDKTKNKLGAFLVGGDLNCRSAQYGGTFAPTGPTHQSGHVLDGFAGDGLEALDHTSSIQLQGAVTIAPGFQLILEAPGMKSDQYGCFTQADAAFKYKLSDHAPVCATFKVVTTYEEDLKPKDPKRAKTQ